MKKAIALWILPFLCSPAAAELRVADRTAASAHLQFRIVVPPVFRILEVTHRGAEDEYRVWTNMPSVAVNGVQYRFQRVGEHVLRVPQPGGDAWIVHGL